MAIVNDSSSVGEFELETLVKYDCDAKLAAVDLFQNYPESLLRLALIICVLFMIIGIPGNLTTIVALARCNKLRNATAIFIINLHISAALFCMFILPMTIMTISQRRWNHGVVMCRIFPLFQYGLNAVSIFSIVAITINRYVIVCHPLLYPKIYKRRCLSIMLLTIWISAFGVYIPSFFGIYGRFELEPNVGFCIMLPDAHNRSPNPFLICFFFAGPYVIIVLCYTRIWWIVRNTAMKSSTRPTHLPISDGQQNTLKNKNRCIFFEPSISTNSTNVQGSMQNSCAVTEEKEWFDRFFKAPFRLTKKEVRSKIPTRKDKKLRTVILAIIMSYCVTHLPIMITWIIYKEFTLHPIANVFANIFEYSWTCTNPLIYVLTSKEYRQAYRNLIESLFCKIKR